MAQAKVKVLDVKPEAFIAALAEKLKKMPELAMPDWAKFVKTSAGKERPPENKDWWYVRAASILRQIYLKGIIGTNRLATRYRAKKKHTASPPRMFKGSRKIIRTILQQAEKAGLVEKVEKPRKGRQLTKKGLELLETTAAEVA